MAETPPSELATSPSAPSAPALAQSAAPSAPHRIAPNVRWNGYKVSARMQGGPGEAFTAVSVTDMEPFIIRVIAISDATVGRRKAWETLKDLPAEQFVPSVDALEEDGWRYEVSRAPIGTNLREWIVCHKAGLTLIERLVGQLSSAIDKLHSKGVAHLNLSPDEIFVQDSGDFVVGGLDSATQYEVAGVWVAAVPPYYAPPEAVRNVRHEPGFGLCAWDWWAVGRMVQEFVLGKHVMSFLFDTDMATGGEDLRLKAEALMCERDPPNVRAGAVEMMPEMPAAVQRLLRGLLTSARDARWGSGAVKRWLEHQPVKEKYDFPTDSQLFVWQGLGLTPAEASDIFSSEEYWAEGERQLLEPPSPGSFSAFLEKTDACKADWKALQAIIGGIDAADWSDVPSAARKTAVAALSWRKLTSGKSQRPILLLRGRRVEHEGLIALLKADNRVQSYHEIQAMISTHFRAMVAVDDAVLARTLDGWAATWARAFQHAREHEWISPGDIDAAMQMLELVLEPEKPLAARVVALKSDYPASAMPEVSRLLSGAETGVWVNVLLAFTGFQPDRFGYIQRSAWMEGRRSALKTEYDEAVCAVVAGRLQRLVWLDGGILTGRWEAFLAASVALSGYSVFRAHELMIGFITVAGLLGLRIVALWQLRNRVLPLLPPGQTMASRDGWAGAGQLSRLLAKPGPRPKPSELAQRLAKTRKAMAELGGMSRPAARAPGFLRIGLVVIMALVWVFLGASAMNLAHTSPEVISLQRQRIVEALAKRAATISTATRAIPTQIKLPAFPGVPPEIALKLASGRYEIVDDGFGPRLRGPLQKWSLYAKDPILPLPVAASEPATGDQKAEALVNAALLLRSYGQHSVNALIAIPVPCKKGTGYLVYNGKEHAISDPNTYILRKDPTQVTWYQLGSERMVYLGKPSAIATEDPVLRPIPEVPIDPTHLFQLPADVDSLTGGHGLASR